VELTRDIAQRFNNLYGETFKVPEPWIPKVGARVMDLLDPLSKMSKSDEIGNGRVCLMDDPADIMRKFKRAVTDSDSGDGCVRYDQKNKPGVANLMQIYSACTGRTYSEIEAEFAHSGYGVFKNAVGESVVETLRPIREEANRILSDKAYIRGIYAEGAKKASYIAGKTLRKVYRKVGLVEKPF
jgi:tryptophanyl-tRNA synthetase